MPIYRKISPTSQFYVSDQLTDIPVLSPITIQAGVPDYSFMATLSVSGLTIVSHPQNWALVFKIMQGSTVLGSHWMGNDNGGWQPSFTLSAVGDVCSTGLTEDIHVKWQAATGVKAILKERASFSILYDDRLD